MKALVILGTLLYTVSPIDIVPDFLPVLGWLDDIGVIALAVRYLTKARDLAEERREAHLVNVELVASTTPTENRS